MEAAPTPHAQFQPLEAVKTAAWGGNLYMEHDGMSIEGDRLAILEVQGAKRRCFQHQGECRGGGLDWVQAGLALGGALGSLFHRAAAGLLAISLSSRGGRWEAAAPFGFWQNS